MPAVKFFACIDLDPICLFLDVHDENNGPPAFAGGDGKPELLTCHDAIKIDGCVKILFHRRGTECAEKRLLFK